ncbi:MAG: DUF3971 domain-containing protein, partial [Gammaproteobacteria bacterium]|nr:DUF3971 domain-containing protein [Gammaproteobacteria bacterium]
ISGKNANILLPIGSSKNISPVTLVTKMRWFQKNGVFKVTTSALKIDNSQWHLFGQFLSEINLQKTPAVSFSGNTILNGLNIKNIQGTIPNFKNPILMLHAQIETDLYKALLLLRQSALPISTHLSEVKGSGPLLCDVQVKLPLAEKNSAISAQGKIHFLGDQLDLLEWNLPLTELTGVATFDQDNFSATGLKTLLFQQLMSVSIGMRPSLHLSVSGIITPGQFASRFNLPILKGVNKKTHVNVQLIFSNLNSEHLSQLNAVMDNLYYVHQSWHHLSLSVKPKSTETVIQLQNPNVSGEITIPDNSKLPLNANFNYLFLQSEKDFDSSKVELINPANIRPLIISIDHFHLDQKAEGHLNLITQPINDGLAIKTIKINSPFLKFSANGSWTQRDGKTKTVLTGEVESPNLGSLLMQRHLSSRLKGGVLSSSFSLAWPNTPQQFLITKSSGKMDIKITNGRILQLDSDTESNLLLGKIFNLLSLESLSHLLTFNFSSFTKSGFLFDVLQGNVKLDNGILSSREIEIDSPVAKIDFSGTINLINQLNNLNMTVFPRVSSSLPVLVAFAGGPVIGAAAWLANKLVSPVVSDIMQMHYHISGTLNKPVLKKLDN